MKKSENGSKQEASEDLKEDDFIKNIRKFIDERYELLVNIGRL